MEQKAFCQEGTCVVYTMVSYMKSTSKQEYFEEQWIKHNDTIMRLPLLLLRNDVSLKDQQSVSLVLQDKKTYLETSNYKQIHCSTHKPPKGFLLCERCLAMAHVGLCVCKCVCMFISMRITRPFCLVSCQTFGQGQIPRGWDGGDGHRVEWWGWVGWWGGVEWGHWWTVDRYCERTYNGLRQNVKRTERNWENKSRNEKKWNIKPGNRDVK